MYQKVPFRKIIAQGRYPGALLLECDHWTFRYGSRIPTHRVRCRLCQATLEQRTRTLLGNPPSRWR